MKTILKTAFAILLVFLLSECRKDDTVFKTYFSVNWSDSDAPLQLFIDDKYRGDVPTLLPKLTHGNDSLKNLALFLELKSGKYKISVKDQNGVVKSSGKMQIGKTKTSSSGGVGGQEISVSGETALVNFMQ